MGAGSLSGPENKGVRKTTAAVSLRERKMGRLALPSWVSRGSMEGGGWPLTPDAEMGVQDWRAEMGFGGVLAGGVTLGYGGLRRARPAHRGAAPGSQGI